MLEEKAIPWQSILETLVRRRRLALAVAVAGSLAAVALAWSTPPVYKAKGTIILAAQRVSGPRVDAMSDKQIESELALLSSPALVRGVLEPHGRPAAGARREVARRSLAGLLRNPLPALYRRLHGLPPPDPADQRVRAVAAGIEATRIPDTNLIEVAYLGDDPVWAARFVNQLLAHHVERIAHLNEQSDVRSFFQAQRGLLSRRLEKARAALNRFREQQGAELVSADDSELRSRLGRLETDIAAGESDLAEARARVSFLEGEIARRPPRIETESQTRENEEVKMLNARLLQLEVQRSDLLLKYAPGSSAIAQIDAQIADTKRRLEGRQESTLSESRTEVNPAFQTLDVDLLQKRAQIASLEARLGALRQQRAGVHAQLDHSGATSPELERLETEVKIANESYLNSLRREEDARLSHALDESKIVNISIVDQAEVPGSPEPSRARWWILAGVLASCAAGALAAFVRDRMDPSVKSRAQVERLAGVPVIAEIPS